MLLHLPGINVNNVRSVMESCESLADLATRTEVDMRSMIGGANAKLLKTFLNQTGS